MIYQTIYTVGQFADAFYMAGRRDNFSYEAKEILFNFYNELEDNIELDIVAICCDWAEIPLEYMERETGCQTLEKLEESTTVYELSNGNILYLTF